MTKAELENLKALAEEAKAQDKRMEMGTHGGVNFQKVSLNCACSPDVILKLIEQLEDAETVVQACAMRICEGPEFAKIYQNKWHGKEQG